MSDQYRVEVSPTIDGKWKAVLYSGTSWLELKITKTELEAERWGLRMLKAARAPKKVLR